MVFTSYGKRKEIKFYTDMYSVDGSTYVGAVLIENGEPVEYYGDITTCIPFSTMEEEEVVLDTNNCGNAADAMVEQGYVKLTRRKVKSGFCEYPVGKLTKKFFNEELKEDK